MLHRKILKIIYRVKYAEYSTLQQYTITLCAINILNYLPCTTKLARYNLYKLILKYDGSSFIRKKKPTKFSNKQIK